MRRKNYFNRERLGITSLLKGTILTALLFLSAVGYSQCYYTVELDDTFGDGWNGNQLEVTVGGVSQTITLSNGSSDTAMFSVYNGVNFELNYLGGGSFNGEVSFDLVDDNNNTIYQSGTGPFTGVHFSNPVSGCPSCDYVIDGFDSFGDGWNGASIDIDVNGTITNFTVSGSSGSINIPSANGDNVSFTFNSGSFDSEITFDIYGPGNVLLGSYGPNPSTGTFLTDVSNAVCPPPSCPLPTNVTVTNVTSTSAIVSWSGSGSNYEIAYVPSGNPAPTGPGTSVTGTTDTLTGLSAGTNYDVYVREICGGSLGNSSWQGPEFFQTAIQFPQGTNCTVGYDSLLFEEEFNSLSNWTNSPAEWNTNSGTTGSSSTGPSGAQSGFSYAYVETSGFYNSTTDLTSPLIELSNFGGDAELTFWMHAYGAQIGTLDVDIATSPSGPYTTEFTWSGQFQTDETDPWQHIGVDLSSYVGQDIYVRFSYTSGSSFTSDIAIDQVRVNACFDCSYLAGFSIGNDTTYCANQGITLPLDAGPADSYTWSTSETTQTITVDTAGQYSVTKDVAGCQLSDTIELFSTPFINLDLGPDTSYCADESINLSLNAQNPTASFMWTDSSTSQFLTVDTAGIYSVTVTDTNGCSTTDGVYVVEHQIPNVVLPADSDYCADQTIAYTLDAGNPLASGYLWQDNSTNQTFTATTAGTYWVEVTDMNGCTNADTMDIIEDPLPVIDLGNDTSYCDSEDFNITLDADNPTADFWWNDGSDDQTLLVDSDGTYWVEVTSTQNCVNSDTLTVIENASPEVDLGNDTVLSPGYTITLDAGNAGTYLWNDGSTDTTKTITWNDVPGEFSVQVESTDGCVNADFIFIDANTGIEDVVKGDIKVYPNPTRDNANIDMNLKESGEMTIEVYSLSGQLLQQQQYGASVGHQVVPVDLSTVESGMYIINLKLNNERIANFNITKM
ncbi:MAG: T9SS type A sorting domain-containing protein [Salibacter sp.]|uniref:T9SS-dependent choice-of-anchor J family protein n=1 Tax=Salibacter sp. TaxID=2010995 RepID=UPI0028701357|nr:T9SS type A sorting domain-containing protein [Salibacter sp.]MDR9399683.1 T9SS type A sorting domain-containing protein [Salibacter sp.]